MEHLKEKKKKGKPQSELPCDLSENKQTSGKQAGTVKAVCIHCSPVQKRSRISEAQPLSFSLTYIAGA